MNDNIAYFNLYYTIALSFALISIVYVINEYRGIMAVNFSKFIIFLMILSAILLFGCRPYNVGTDTPVYLSRFLDAKYFTVSFKDFGYGLLVNTLSHFLSDRGFFIFCSFLLVFFIYISYRSIFKSKLLLPLLMLYCSFFFLAYGINIIRAGIAYSFFLCVIANKNNKFSQIIFSLLAISFHLSILFPLALWFIYSNTKLLSSIRIPLILWIICLILLIININVVPFFSTIFEQIDFESTQTRINSYLFLTESKYRTGIRYDFIFFSFIFISIGLYLRKKVYTDEFYEIILKIFITANAVFLLMMRFPYSDRYGLLSWSLIPILYCYPLLKSNNKKYLFILFVGIYGMLALNFYIN